MKFADKLFVAVTALLTIIFMIFGTWMLHSYFARILNRELEQGSAETQMLQYLFEIAYHSTEEYGMEYAVDRAIDSVSQSVEKEGTGLVVQSTSGEILHGDSFYQWEGFSDAMETLKNGLTEENTFSGGILQLQEGYYLLTLVRGADENVYLGLCRNLTGLYQDRQALMNQYRLALVLLLLTGGFFIFLLSRYITRPIRRLGQIAVEVAAGDYEKRADYDQEDEIGELADSFDKMTNRLVEQMKEKELEAKQKEDFTSAFAHELKTPLTSIIGYADMLNTVELSEEERAEALYYIYSQGKRLESLSHKLLELVSIEKHPLLERPISTRALEENLRDTMRPIFQKKGIKSKISLEKGELFGDYELLLSLLYNLLDNAVKAVDEGGFILMKGSRLEVNYEIKVVDNGRGIPQEEIGRITEAFYMVDKSRSRKEGGAGIGMALCQKIITLHHGTLKIDSRLGEGTVIQLLFPLKQEKAMRKRIGNKKEKKNEKR